MAACCSESKGREQADDDDLLNFKVPSSIGDGQPIQAGEEGHPLFSFGVITDVQYADIEDGKSYSGVPRYYRHSLEVLRRAVASWNDAGDLAFVMQFGDIVDGYCPKDQSQTAVETVLREFGRFQGGPVYHMIGNHCLYNLPRPELNKLLEIPSAPDHGSYYHFCPFPGFRFVVLDGYDVSVLGWPPGHPHAEKAEEILRTRNPNMEKNSPEGLVGVARRFVKFGGGVGEGQLAWLDATLKAAGAAGERVVVGCHLPLDPEAAAHPACLLWNFEEVMEVVHSHRCVVACLSGHVHQRGHSRDCRGVHHVVLEAALECPPTTSAFGRIDVYPDRLSLIGTDRMASKELAIETYQRP